MLVLQQHEFWRTVVPVRRPWVEEGGRPAPRIKVHCLQRVEDILPTIRARSVDGRGDGGEVGEMGRRGVRWRRAIPFSVSGRRTTFGSRSCRPTTGGSASRARWCRRPSCRTTTEVFGALRVGGGNHRRGARQEPDLGGLLDHHEPGRGDEFAVDEQVGPERSGWLVALCREVSCLVRGHVEAGGSPSCGLGRGAEGRHRSCGRKQYPSRSVRSVAYLVLRRNRASPGYGRRCWNVSGTHCAASAL